MMRPSNTALLDLGLELGLTACGVARCGPSDYGTQLDAWLERGAHAEMGWLARTANIRKDLHRRWPWAKSALVAVQSYLSAPRDRRRLPGIGPYIARYAQGQDYHELLESRIGSWGDAVEHAVGVPVRRAVLVDTAAILEREMAVRAGLGWIGKNACLIGPEGDSWRFIGVLLTDLDLEPTGATTLDRCGSCRACLDACPTDAFAAPFVVDARRCISYLTIEHRGPFPTQMRASIGDWFFGCDVCQEVCPWNRRVEPTAEPALGLREEYADTQLADVAALDVPAFRQRFRRTPLLRPKRAGLVRNALTVGANIDDAATIEVAEQLLDDPEPAVRETAAWVLDRNSV
ncbi:MAG: tRNA epoxyqueuosine(34) reductase QueG [Acidobacteriota bacterium]